jgi:hypothetical protein
MMKITFAARAERTTASQAYRNCRRQALVCSFWRALMSRGRMVRRLMAEFQGSLSFLPAVVDRTLAL